MFLSYYFSRVLDALNSYRKTEKLGVHDENGDYT